MSASSDGQCPAVAPRGVRRRPGGVPRGATAGFALGMEPCTPAPDTALGQLAALIREELRAFRGDLTAPEFVDKHSSGLGPSVFLAAARAGEFDTFRVGKRFVARAADVRAYIERQLVPRERARTKEPKVDEFDVQLTPRVKRVGPNRVARSRSPSEP